MGFIYRWKIRKIIEFLKKSSPENFLRIGDNRLISVFQHAAKNVPAYKLFLKEKGVDPSKVSDKESFKRLVPIITKEIFDKYELQELCVGGSVNTMKQAAVSSGFSGNYAYGLTKKKELRDLILFTDALLAYAFSIDRLKTLLISSLGMGVRIHTSLPLAEVSVRPDMIIALVKRLARQFDGIIIIGNPYFLKKVIEDGIEKGLDWRRIPVRLVIGEDWFPEDFRTYLAHLLGLDLDGSQINILSTLGICELGLSLFQESAELARIRRRAEKDSSLRSDIFGENTDISPILFQYHPYEIFLEEIAGELIFTTLSPDAIIPLIRYASGDRGKLYPYNNIEDILIRHKHGEAIPQLKLPMVSMIGRSSGFIKVDDIPVTPEQVKAGIYNDFELAGSTTGYFRMSKQDNRLRIEVQLKEKAEVTDRLKEKFLQAIAGYVKTDFELRLYPYRDFPYGMGLIYEEKFKYI